MLEKLRIEDFTPLVGTTLSVEFDGARTDLEVKEARPLPLHAPREIPGFRVTLRSRAGWRARQGLYRLHHPTLGALEVFAVPIGPDGDCLCYEVIFN